jgi:hypothetical protein
VLSFENAAVKAGVARDAPVYRAAWFNLDNSTGSATPIGESEGAGGRISAPSGLTAKTGEYVAVDLRAVGGANESWSKPVRISFLRLAGGWKLVGLERMP